MRTNTIETTEETTYVAWGIFSEMLRGMTDDQLLVVDRLVRAERKERFRRPSKDRRELFGMQALRRVSR